MSRCRPPLAGAGPRDVVARALPDVGPSHAKNEESVSASAAAAVHVSPAQSARRIGQKEPPSFARPGDAVADG
jgi:hypothetical protein